MILDCQCHAPHHAVRFDFFEDEVVVYVQLVHWRPWWKRVYLALRYILGFEEPWGHWDTFLLKPDDVMELRERLKPYEKLGT